jgi:hypothetical protein
MLLLVLAAQAATVTATPSAPAAKPAKICEMREVTGSRSKKRVCRDSTGRLDLGPGIKDATGDAVGAEGGTSTSGSTPN